MAPAPYPLGPPAAQSRGQRGPGPLNRTRVHKGSAAGCGGGTPRDALEGGKVPPPSRAPSLCPATVPLTPCASLKGICNRQYPPATALATSSNRLSNRFWGRLQGPFPSDASLGTPPPSGPLGRPGGPNRTRRCPRGAHRGPRGGALRVPLAQGPAITRPEAKRQRPGACSAGAGPATSRVRWGPASQALGAQRPPGGITSPWLSGQGFCPGPHTEPHTEPPSALTAPESLVGGRGLICMGVMCPVAEGGMFARRVPGACPERYHCIKYLISSPKSILTEGSPPSRPQ